MTINYSEEHDEIGLSMRTHWGQRGADLGIRLFRGYMDIIGSESLEKRVRCSEVIN